VTIGTPAENVRVYIGCASAPASPGDVVPLQPINMTGELLVAGANVASGYLNRPEANLKSFRPDAYAGSGRMYCTGDLARRLPDGRVMFVGRADSQIKIRGFRVEVSEVSAAIQKSCSARRVEVLLKEGALVAYVTPQLPDNEINCLSSELGRWLPPYMIPARVVCLPEFPLNKNGKIDASRLPLPELGLVSAADVGDRAPRTSAEVAIHKVWCSMLGLKPEAVARGDNFFRLGGTSLLAVVMSRKVNSTLGCNLGIADVFNKQTLDALARVADPGAQAVELITSAIIEEAPKAESCPPLVMLPPQGAPMNPCVFFLCQVLGLSLISVLGAAPLSALVAGTVRVAQEHGLVAAALVFPLLVAGASLAFLLLVLATKWLIVGRFRPGTYCVRGGAFLRWWLMRKVLSLPRALLWVLDDTPLVPLWYRLLGASVGRGVSMENVEILEPDLVTIGHGCRLEYHVRLVTSEVAGDGLRYGRVKLGERVSCGVRSIVVAGACIASGCRVDAKAHVYCDSTEPLSRLEGCPATAVGFVPPVGRLVPRRTACLYLLQALGALLIILSMEVAFLAAIACIVVLWMSVHSAAAVTFTALFTTIVCSIVWLLEIVGLKWLLLGRVRPSDSPRTGAWFLARKWVIDRMLLSPAHHYAGLLVLQTSSTGPLYYRMLGVRVGARAWVNHMYIRAGVDTVSMGSNSHWGRDSCLFTDSVSADGVIFKASNFGDHVSVGQWVVCMPGVRLGDSVNVGAETLLTEGLQAEARSTVFGCPPLKFSAGKSDAEVVAQTQLAAEHMRQQMERSITEGSSSVRRSRSGKSEHSLQDVFALKELDEEAPAPAEVADIEGVARMQDIGGGSHFYTYVVVTLLLQSLGPCLMAISFGGVWLLITEVLLPERLRAADSDWVRMLLVPPIYLGGAAVLILLLALLGKCGLTDFRSGSESFFSFRFLLWHVFADGIYFCSSTVLYPFSGTAIFVLWLRLMGAKIGKNVFVSPEQGGYRELNFLDIGDNAVVLTPNLHAHYTDHGTLQFAPVKIAAGCRINVGATVLPLTKYESGCTLRPFAVAMKGQKFEAGTVYVGNPSVPMPGGTAILLSGQGTQYAGMLSQARELPAVAAMLKEARELLHYDVADLDDAELTRAENSHVAVFLADLAAFERLRNERPHDVRRCTAVLGFSIGEIPALVVAGALSFTAALHLVRERGRAVEELCAPGAMCNVVGLRRSEVERLCSECGCAVANVLVSYDSDTSGNVLVCSGDADSVDRLVAAAKQAGAAKASRLTVGYAFHSAALLPAIERFRAAVKAARLAPPTLVVYSNVTGAPYPASIPEMEHLLTQQLVSRVEWHSSLAHLRRPGNRPSAIFECGPKRELKAVMRRFDREMWESTVSVEVGEKVGAGRGVLLGRREDPATKAARGPAEPISDLGSLHV
jgi:malonyl CoA-acyl carrier protein transacylase/acetyltransferase-like isoleucine patch superfamily enzyme